MENFIGVKIIKAEPKKADGIDGYKVVYPQVGGGTYISWSPKEVFEMAYRKISKEELSFLK
jgi:hypothetical protein